MWHYSETKPETVLITIAAKLCTKNCCKLFIDKKKFGDQTDNGLLILIEKLNFIIISVGALWFISKKSIAMGKFTTS